MKKTVLAIIVLIVCALLTYYFIPKGTTASVEQITEVVAKKGTLQLSMEADGKSEVSNIKLGFAVNGVLKSLAVEPGDSVKKGDVIARLDTRSFEYEVASAQANYQADLAKVDNTRTQNKSQVLAELNKLNSAKTQWEKDRREYEAMLQAADAFAQQELDLKKLALDNSVKNYETAKQSYANAKNNSTKLEEASVAQSRATLDKAEKNLEDAELRAPTDGVILALNNKVGETVSSSSDFAVISDGEGTKVYAQVLEMDIKDVFLGQTVEMEFEAVPSQIFTGKVAYIDSLPISDPNGVVAYNVEIKLDRPHELNQSGSSCVVTFIIKQKKDVLVIPNDAVKLVNGKQVVEVKDKTAKLSQRQIKTGFTDGTNVEITEGLDPGETVIIRKPAPAVTATASSGE